MITRIPRKIFSHCRLPGTVFESPAFGLFLSKQYTSPSDDRDSPAGVSSEAKAVSTEEDDAVLEVVTSASQLGSQDTKRVSSRSSYDQRSERNQQYKKQSKWIENIVKTREVKKKADDSSPDLSNQFSEAVKSLRSSSHTSPLDIIDDSFFVTRRRQSKVKEEQSRKSPSKLQSVEYGERVKEAARRVTAKAGEASAVLEEELMKGLQQLDNQTRQKQAIRAPLSSGPDLDLLDSIVHKQATPKKSETLTPKQKTRPQQQLSDFELLDKVNEVASIFTNNLRKQPEQSMQKPVVHLEKAKMYNSLEDLLSEPPLNIFSKKSETKSGKTLQLWSTFELNEVQRNTSFQPSNWWSQCIKWTEEGKMWHFPINNEQGMVEEENVDFTEHIFLDEHIESWCPKQGPIRHFMELVLIGLSKNPYLSVGEKVENIEWFQQYFEKHKTLLRDINVYGEPGSEDKSEAQHS